MSKVPIPLQNLVNNFLQILFENLTISMRFFWAIYASWVSLDLEPGWSLEVDDCMNNVLEVV